MNPTNHTKLMTIASVCFFAFFGLSCSPLEGDDENHINMEDMNDDSGEDLQTVDCTEFTDENSCLNNQNQICGWFVLQGTTIDSSGACTCEGTQGFCVASRDVATQPYAVISSADTQNPSVAYWFNSRYATNDNWTECRTFGSKIPPVCLCSDDCGEVSRSWSSQ